MRLKLNAKESVEVSIEQDGTVRMGRARVGWVRDVTKEWYTGTAWGCSRWPGVLYPDRHSALLALWQDDPVGWPQGHLKGGAPRSRATVPVEGGQPCLCGCGQMARSRFVPGHDSKLKSLFLRVERGRAETSAIPAIAQTYHEEWKKARCT